MGLKLNFGGRIIYQFVLCVTKLGICAFYLRMFQDHADKIYIYLIIIFLLITTIPIEFASLFQCNPVSGGWTLGTTAKCLKAMPSIYAAAISSILSDVFLMAFVFPRVSKWILGRFTRPATNFAHTSQFH